MLQFLKDYRLHPESRKINLEHLASYIRKENGAERLTQWSVVVASGEGEGYKIGGHPIRAVLRKWDLSWAGLSEVEAKRLLIVSGRFRMQGVNDPSIEALHLDAEQRAAAPGSRPTSVWLRENLGSKRGILTLYPVSSIDREQKETKDPALCDFAEAAGVPITGFVMSLPVVDGGGSKVDYIVNTVYKAELEDIDE